MTFPPASKMNLQVVPLKISDRSKNRLQYLQWNYSSFGTQSPWHLKHHWILAHEKGHEGGDSQHTKSGRCCHCVSDAKFHCLLEVKSRHALAGKSFWNFNLWCSDFAGKATKSFYHQQAWSMHTIQYDHIAPPTSPNCRSIWPGDWGRKYHMVWLCWKTETKPETNACEGDEV